MTSNKKLARKIARSLFTDGGSGKTVARLLLANENKALTGSGWSESAMASHILQMLPRPRRVKRVKAWGSLGANGEVLTACVNRVDPENDAKKSSFLSQNQGKSLL